MLRHIALLTIAATSLASSLAGSHLLEPAAASPNDTVTFSCGGYDAAGVVVNQEAAAIGDFEADPAAPDIPPVCGGYTEDGVFVGDD